MPLDTSRRRTGTPLGIARLPATLALLLSLGFGAPSHAMPAFVPLGDLPGDVFESSAGAVSADGTTVVGGSRSTGVGPLGSEAFRWRAETGMVGLGDLPGGGIFSSPRGVSSDGSVVVGTGTVNGGILTGQRAFRWTETGGLQNLGSIALGATSGASDVTADGSMLVGSVGTPAGRVAATHTSADGWQRIQETGGGDLIGSATDISDDGSVIAGTRQFPTGLQEGFLLTEESGLETLPFIPAGISGDGNRIVGSPASQAAYWSSDEGVVELGLLGGIGTTRAFAASHDGSVIVGQAIHGPFLADRFAIVWDEHDGVRSVKSILEAQGIDLSNFALEAAVGISADGLTISGQMTNFQGRPEAFLAILPEPSTAALLGVGLVLLGKRRRD